MSSDRIIFEQSGLLVVEHEGRLFVRYDAGSHQEILRQDEITPEEFEEIKTTRGGFYNVIIRLQRRLGLDAYTSNWSPPPET